MSKQIGGSHYNKYEIEPIDFINKNKLSYMQGNVIKYVVRYKDKNKVEDLLKAKHYIDMMIEELWLDVDYLPTSKSFKDLKKGDLFTTIDGTIMVVDEVHSSSASAKEYVGGELWFYEDDGGLRGLEKGHRLTFKEAL